MIMIIGIRLQQRYRVPLFGYASLSLTLVVLHCMVFFYLFLYDVHQNLHHQQRQNVNIGNEVGKGNWPGRVKLCTSMRLCSPPLDPALIVLVPRPLVLRGHTQPTFQSMHGKNCTRLLEPRLERWLCVTAQHQWSWNQD